MRKSLNFFVLSILGVIMAIAATDTSAATTGSPASGVVNVNTAEVTQLTMLPKIGAKVAQRVIDYRKEHGPFKTTSDLMQVKGIGQKSFDRITTYVTVDGKTTLTAKIAAPHKARARSARQSTAASR